MGDRRQLAPSYHAKLPCLQNQTWHNSLSTLTQLNRSTCSPNNDYWLRWVKSGWRKSKIKVLNVFLNIFLLIKPFSSLLRSFWPTKIKSSATSYFIISVCWKNFFDTFYCLPQTKPKMPLAIELNMYLKQQKYFLGHPVNNRQLPCLSRLAKVLIK